MYLSGIASHPRGHADLRATEIPSAEVVYLLLYNIQLKYVPHMSSVEGAKGPYLE